MKKSHDHVSDHERTIVKFRQLTAQLQEQIQDLKDKLLMQEAKRTNQDAGDVVSTAQRFTYTQTKAWSEVILFVAFFLNLWRKKFVFDSFFASDCR